MERNIIHINSVEKGITLVALVITVIILVILTTVGISMAYKSKIVDYATDASKDYAEKSVTENKIMEGTGELLDSTVKKIGDILAGNIPSAGTPIEKPNDWTSDNITAIGDGSGKPVPLPKEFYYIGGDLNTGIVISDRKEDTLDSSGVEMGNQFVWIPIKNAEMLKRTLFDGNGKEIEGLSDTYKEPYNDAEKQEYDEIIRQVLEYGGFFVGRFEAGINSVDLREGTTEAKQVVCKRGVAPYNHIPWGKNMNDASEIEGKSGAVHLARSMYKDSQILSSTLCYGFQWDAVCRYIGDENRKASTPGTIQLTGSDNKDVSKNIYDLAGNCLEWTMEAEGNDYRVQRGGFCDYDGAISDRTSTRPSITSGISGFRITLYIK